MPFQTTRNAQIFPSSDTPEAQLFIFIKKEDNILQRLVVSGVLGNRVMYFWNLSR